MECFVLVGLSRGKYVMHVVFCAHAEGQLKCALPLEWKMARSLFPTGSKDLILWLCRFPLFNPK